MTTSHTNVSVKGRHQPQHYDSLRASDQRTVVSRDRAIWRDFDYSRLPCHCNPSAPSSITVSIHDGQAAKMYASPLHPWNQTLANPPPPGSSPKPTARRSTSTSSVRAYSWRRKTSTCRNTARSTPKTSSSSKLANHSLAAASSRHNSPGNGTTTRSRLKGSTTFGNGFICPLRLSPRRTSSSSARTRHREA